jgi:amidohydrolase
MPPTPLTLAAKHLPKIVRLRRDIHAHPELGLEETRTASLVSRTLRGLSVRTTTGIAKTGVVGSISGTGSGKCVALRADMDALPIQEETGLPFASVNAGVMHACGHDAHSAMLLGAAMILQELRGTFAGSVKLIFQPSEERHPGGAQAMIEAGVLEAPVVDVIYGQHVIAQADAGNIGFCAGAMMASADELYITIRGKGGHGAMPHRTIDPIVVAAQVILALQTIVSRRASPFQECVLTIGKIAGGTTTNIIPDEVELVGTFRAMDASLRTRAHKEINRILRGITSAAGATYTFRISHGYPALINDPAVTQDARGATERLLGSKRVFVAEPLMGAEDFAYFLQHVPGTYYRIGIRNPGQKHTPDIHTSRFTIDEKALLNGSATLAHLAIDYLTKHS